MRGRSEHDEQAALFRWAGFARVRWPELAVMHAVPNGGHRRKATAGMLKAEGVRRGVPDICLPVPRAGFHGLYIELKTRRGTATRDQRWWIDALRRLGYRAEICRGWEAARAVIEDYLDGTAGAGDAGHPHPHPLQGGVKYGEQRAEHC
ncbi:VRR-NUC domain-containing protein [Aquisalimonas sp. 2447]|uniref:VRR-NUC domain-containing protein n=1 Tax=Aquisalimonas sp. 2447 TaxID=2740807 RepID=UPI0014326964|nr:VRR-NUC domain-containing protein [Aquisalimonas sp. 2447]QIT54106.1 VRR-NUC domain-containing protein [Aquisalimonas sp. 2447]